MLTIYARHNAPCRAALCAQHLSLVEIRAYRKCRCPKWYSGTHEGQYHPRTSLGTDNWNAAAKALDAIKLKLQQGQQAHAGTVTVEVALREWIAEVELGGAAAGTVTQWRSLGERLLQFCQRRHIPLLKDLNALAINGWRTEWSKEHTNRSATPGIKRSTAGNRITVLKHFFSFTRRMRWIPENPMDLIGKKGKKDKVDYDDEASATMPLDLEGDSNYRDLLAAIPAYCQHGPSGRKLTGLMVTRPDHLVAITELMYETGLRVSDAIMFDVSKVVTDADGWGEYTTRQIKTGKLVTAGIPPELLIRIQSLPRISPRYVFYDGGSGLNAYNTAQIWRHLKAVGERIGLVGMHPHRLRDSFAVNRLNEGMLLEDVSRSLGHASVTMTERYYAPFVKSRKDLLMAKRKAAHGGHNVTAINKRKPYGLRELA